MKNIRIYHPKKYEGERYKKVCENIYQTVLSAQKTNIFSLKSVNDKELANTVRNLSGWKQCELKMAENYLCIEYNGQEYFREKEDEDGEDYIYVFNPRYLNQIVYVTSLMFEQEPEFDENQPTDKNISQYPLEDILDKFACCCRDEYLKENEEDKVNSYIEFESESKKDIEKLLTIIGKHVYNKEENGKIKLIIE